MAVLNFYHVGKTIPEGAVYIGRANAKFGLAGSRFANPFPVRSPEERGTTIERYQQWLIEEIRSGRITQDDLLALEGKDLVCYCAPKACHGHVLQKAIEAAVRRRAASCPTRPRMS